MGFNHYMMNLDLQEKVFIMEEKCHRIEGGKKPLPKTKCSFAVLHILHTRNLQAQQLVRVRVTQVTVLSKCLV